MSKYVGPERRVGPGQAVEQLVAQRLVDGAHPVRAFGMAGAGIVIDETRMGVKQRRHGISRAVS
jgi:hypothetical protein